MSPEEEEPFLLTDRALKDLDRDYPREPGAQSGSHYSPAAVLLIHLGIIAIYTITSISIIRSQRSCLTIYPPVAIDNLDVSYTTTLFRRLNGTPYAGPPSAETNAAWNALMAPMHISVSKVELDRDNQASVALPEKGGYLGWMGVFHQLHCIRMLRKSYYNHPSGSLSRSKKEQQHLDHCFEMLRQSAVCHADASLTTFLWDPGERRPMFNASESVHRCVDWERLMNSIKHRVVNEDEILRLRNPLFQDMKSML